ncbi:HPr-rel-A system PqqD family peptide chaperone [Sphingobium sp. AN641]|uniref:HPr-rel-A system PqqD family peptide chaperone n=1 Tax=Sphingobium sp. AN641 TaxID=3133443 RepID=UPI0030BBC8DD
MTTANYYRAEPQEALVMRPLADIVLLYHRPSGRTHMVVSPVPEILDALQRDGGGTAISIHARLARDFDLGPPDEALAEIAAHLAELADLGLAYLK